MLQILRLKSILPYTPKCFMYEDMSIKLQDIRLLTFRNLLAVFVHLFVLILSLLKSNPPIARNAYVKIKIQNIIK